MNTSEGKFSPDQFLSPERAAGANDRLKMEKEEQQKQREKFLEDFDLKETIDEYSQNIPSFDKIKDQIVDELRKFVDSKTGVDLNDPKEGKIIKEELEKKIFSKAQELKEAI
jgi:hypothetical protein